MKTPTSFPYKVEALAGWRGVIYENTYEKNGTTYKGYRLVYRSGEGRKTLGFESIEAALEGAKDLLRKLSKAEPGAVVLANGQGVRYQQAMESLSELPDAPAINIMAADYVSARKVFGNAPNPPSMRELAEFYAQRRGLNLPARTVAEAVSEMLKVKQADGLSERHIEDLKNRLARFGKDFQCQIADLDGPSIAEWLRRLGLSPRSQNNFRGAIQTLMAFAKSCGYLPRDWNEIDAVPTAKNKKGKVEIFSKNEIVKLLATANTKRYQKLAAFIAIGAFAGLRSAELERLTWAKVNLETGYITIDASIAKTNSRRVVPIQPNLAKLLNPIAQKQGKVSAYAHVTPHIMELAKAAGVEWKQNALRHSYASYRLAVTQDAAKVALEMGNSPQMIQQHYRELVTPEQGREWFTV